MGSRGQLVRMVASDRERIGVGEGQRFYVLSEADAQGYADPFNAVVAMAASPEEAIREARQSGWEDLDRLHVIRVVYTNEGPAAWKARSLNGLVEEGRMMGQDNGHLRLTGGGNEGRLSEREWKELSDYANHAALDLDQLLGVTALVGKLNDADEKATMPVRQVVDLLLLFDFGLRSARDQMLGIQGLTQRRVEL